MTKKEIKEELYNKLCDEVIGQIKENLLYGEIDPIGELLKYCPPKNLISFLSEDEWKKYELLWKP